MPAYMPPFVKHLWSRNSNLLRITLSLPLGSVLVASSHLASVSLNCASCFLIIVAIIFVTISNSLDWLETVKLCRVIFLRAWSGILIIFGIASLENSSTSLKLIASFHFLGQYLNVAKHRLWRFLRLYSSRSMLLPGHLVWWSGRMLGYQLYLIEGNIFLSLNRDYSVEKILKVVYTRGILMSNTLTLRYSTVKLDI